MNLTIFVNEERVGVLKQSGFNEFSFVYDENVADNDCISLLMLPSVKKVWDSRELHPVFMTSLPEWSRDSFKIAF